jgi:hypothetical protein
MSLHLHAWRMCGAASFRRVIDRDGADALKPTGPFQCSGCSLVFADPKAWRDGEWEAATSTPPGARPLTSVSAPGSLRRGTQGSTNHFSYLNSPDAAAPNDASSGGISDEHWLVRPG